MIHICPTCDQKLDDEAIVWPIPEVCEKVLPGEVMPAGECPDDGTLIPAPLPEETDDDNS